MLVVEPGAWDVLDPAFDAYESHFKQSFPLYEHLDKTADEGFEISVKGAKRLADFIADHIKRNAPVPIPTDYDSRIY